MKAKSSFGRTRVGNTTQFKDKKGNLEYRVRHQAGQEVYYDRKNYRIGYIDSLGRTMSQDNRILSSQPRPDLILEQLQSCD